MYFSSYFIAPSGSGKCNQHENSTHMHNMLIVMGFMIECSMIVLGADACQPNEIRCSNFGRGRKCVQKFWMCDGDR